MLTKIAAVLDRKGRDVWSVPATATVHDAIRQMAEKRVEALLVVSDQKLVGFLTERDCARRVTLDGKDPRSVRASEIIDESGRLRHRGAYGR